MKEIGQVLLFQEPIVISTCYSRKTLSIVILLTIHSGDLEVGY